MRNAYSITGAFFLIATTTQGATYIPSFTGFASAQVLVPSLGPSYDGWSQSEANPVTVPLDDAPLAYGQAVNYNGDVVPGVALGGVYATPVADSGHISHTISLPIGGNSISLGFTVGRAAAAPPNPQNSFEIGAYTSGGTNLFSFVLSSTGNENAWDMAYRSGGGANIPIFIGSPFALDQVSTLTMNFTANGGNTDFALNLSTLGVPQNVSGTIAVDPSTVMDDFRVTMLKVPLSDPVGDPFNAYGTNFIAVVPEPSGFMLFGLSAGMTMFRRRRAA